jgi:hypothetical protein
MLPIGYITDAGDSHKAPNHWTHLTEDEQRSQMTLWSIARSPLFFGGDIRRLRNTTSTSTSTSTGTATRTASAKQPRQQSKEAAFTLSLLTNSFSLTVNEFSTGNREAYRDGDLRVWAAAVTHTTVHAAAVSHAPPAPPAPPTLSAPPADGQLYYACALFNVGTQQGVKGSVALDLIIGERISFSSSSSSSPSSSSSSSSPVTSCRVTDEWTGADLGTVSMGGNVTATLAAHGTRLLKLSCAEVPHES